jgi:hypothetical protein
MSEPAHDNELAAFQAALARLTPMPEGINIAQLLFRAGQLSAPRRNWVWPCAAAASLLLAIALGCVLAFRPAPRPAERIVEVYVPIPASPAEQPQQPIPSTEETPDTPRPVSDGDYLQLRRAVLAQGLDALPPPAPWPAVAPSDDADTLLDFPTDSRELWFLRLGTTRKNGAATVRERFGLPLPYGRGSDEQH